VFLKSGRLAERLQRPEDDTESMKCALYATSDADVELRILSRYAAGRGWTVSTEYVDTQWPGSTAATPALEKLLRDASAALFDCVLVARIDSFAKSVAQFMERLRHLEALGVRFIAPSQFIDTGDTEPVADAGRMLLNVAKACTQFESMKETPGSRESHQCESRNARQL